MLNLRGKKKKNTLNSNSNVDSRKSSLGSKDSGNLERGDAANQSGGKNSNNFIIARLRNSIRKDSAEKS